MTGKPDAKQFYKYGLVEDHLHLNQFSCTTSNMKVILGSLFFPQYLFIMSKIVWTDESIDFFLVRPGGGEDFVYYPIGVNATLYCAVNVSHLVWTVNDLNFAEFGPLLNSRGIFQSKMAFNGILSSNITIAGYDDTNNNTRVCCRSLVEAQLNQFCTTLVIYDQPSPPENVSVESTNGFFNISWIATNVMGVTHTYIIVFDACMAETTKPYYIFQKNISDAKCSAYVIAVNGAGESDPSNNVSIPSLPDIGPVTASLTHQVWKHDGEIRVNVSFQPATYCLDHPVLNYLLILRRTQTRRSISVFLEPNETAVILHPENGLETDKEYSYSVTAVSIIGNVTSHQDGIVLYTSDVQSVNATVVDKSTIDIQCLFIHGSDALGCKVVLISHCQNVRNVQANLSRSDVSASGRLILTHSISCYHKVFAFDIDVNNSIGNLTIEFKINTTDGVHGADDQVHNIAAAIVLPLILLAILIIFMMVAVFVAIWKTKHKLNYKSASTTSRNGKFLPPDLKCTESPLVQCANERHSKETPATHSDNYSGMSSVCVSDAIQPPLYAIPDKLRSKKSLGSSEGEMEPEQSTCQPQEKSGDTQGLQNEQEHFYHVLEVSSNRSPCNKAITLPDSDAPELPPSLEPDSQDTDILPVYQDINELSCKPNNIDDCEHCYCQEAHGLKDNVGTSKSHQEEGEDRVTVEESHGVSDANTSSSKIPLYAERT